MYLDKTTLRIRQYICNSSFTIDLFKKKIIDEANINFVLTSKVTQCFAFILIMSFSHRGKTATKYTRNTCIKLYSNSDQEVMIKDHY